MSALADWALLMAYTTGWLVAAVLMTRQQSLQPRCHAEGTSGYRWTNARDCRRYCGKGCLRVPESPALRDLGIGSSLALAWPVVGIGIAILHVAGRAPRSARHITAEEIERLEREAGIR